MKLFCYTYGHNEIDLLPLKKKWCDYHGLTMRYFDNESTDGSKEWAEQHDVLVGEINTDGAFDLRLILPELNEDLIAESPHWFCMLGVDLFICPTTDVRLCDFVAKHGKVIDCLETQYANICFTGTECQDGNLRHFDRAAIKGEYSMAFSTYTLMVKYHPSAFMAADKINIPEWWEPSQVAKEWWLINFGHTKTASERQETFERRKLAWKRGLTEFAGAHYRTGSALDWTYPKIGTIDIATHPTLSLSHANLLKQLYE